MRAAGNVARFVRVAGAGEAATLVLQAVHTDSRHPRAPRLAMFAARDLAPGEELLRPPPGPPRAPDATLSCI
jgi:hypothetical protein